MIEEHRDVMMENYQEKYKKELYQQEINSNIHTLKGFFWIFVTILLLWLLTLVRIFIVDARIFTMAAGVSAVMGIPVLYIYKKVDLSKHWVKYVFLNTDLYDIGSHCGIFVIPCGAYLCVAVAFGGTVQGADDTVDHLCCQ